MPQVLGAWLEHWVDNQLGQHLSAQAQLAATQAQLQSLLPQEMLAQVGGLSALQLQARLGRAHSTKPLDRISTASQ